VVQQPHKELVEPVGLGVASLMPTLVVSLTPGSGWASRPDFGSGSAAGAASWLPLSNRRIRL